MRFFKNFWTVMFCVWVVIWIVDVITGRPTDGASAMVVATLAMIEISRIKGGR